MIGRRLVRVALGLAVIIELGCALPKRPPPPPSSDTELGLAIATRTLPNGMRVIIVTDPDATEVQVTTRYQVGAVDDGPHPGIAHLAEHMMFQQQRRDDLWPGPRRTLFTELEDKATFFNANTTLDATTFITRGRRERLADFIGVEAARLDLRCTTITDEAFAREREVVLQELQQRDQTTEILVALHSGLYPPGHPYSRPVGGSLESVAAIKRAEMCNFVDTYYAPANAVVVISSKLRAADIAPVLDVLGKSTATSITRRQPPMPQVPVRFQNMYLPAPIESDVLVLAWPLPLEPELQAKVRAIGAALPRLVDAQIRGAAIGLEVGDRRAPMYAVAVVPGTDETYDQMVQGTRNAIAELPSVFMETAPDGLDRVVFEKIKQGAIYGFYSSLQDGGDRDVRLAGYVLAGREPSAALSAELDALRSMTRDEGAAIAARYLGAGMPTIVTLRATKHNQHGEAVSLRDRPSHDMGPRRAPPDPALAHHAAKDVPAAAPSAMRTRVLGNGLTVVLVPTTSVPTFDARLVFGSGTADEPVDQRGVALLAAQALTWDLHYKEDLYAFAGAGNLRSADVTSDQTTFSVQGVDSKLDVVLAGLRRWVREGTYDRSAADLVSAIRQATKKFDDQGQLTDVWRAAVYGAQHPYTHAGIARHANPALTLADAARFRSAYFTPDNATLLISGKFDIDLAERWVDYLFADWQGRAAARQHVAAAPQPISIAKRDDIDMVNVRIALPVSSHGRASQLVAAAMLSEIARDVRFRLSASYSFDAALDESRLATFYAMGGWIDATRSGDAVRLIRDRVAELRANPEAAARAFVTARKQVLSQLEVDVSAASALASWISQDLDMGRAPMSDLQTAHRVATLTIDDMTDALADLDLSRATILIRGPEPQIGDAFKLLGRTPQYVGAVPAQDAASAMAAGPGGTPPPFSATEQYVRPSDVERALTARPPQPLLLEVDPGYAFALARYTPSTAELTVRGLGMAMNVGYRLGWHTALGAHGSFSKLTGEFAGSVVPVSLDGFLEYQNGNIWGDALAGVQWNRFAGTTMIRWTSAPSLGAEVGFDARNVGPHRFGLSGRYELTTDGLYSSFVLNVTYRQ